MQQKGNIREPKLSDVNKIIVTNIKCHEKQRMVKEMFEIKEDQRHTTECCWNLDQIFVLEKLP